MYSKELYQRDGSFEHLKHMLKLWVRKYLQVYAENVCLLNLCNVPSFLEKKVMCTIWLIC